MDGGADEDDVALAAGCESLVHPGARRAAALTMSARDHRLTNPDPSLRAPVADARTPLADLVAVRQSRITRQRAEGEEYGSGVQDDRPRNMAHGSEAADRGDEQTQRTRDAAEVGREGSGVRQLVIGTPGNQSDNDR